MAEQHHHHHHHHKADGATMFKRKSLAWIKRRKVIERVLKKTLFVIAVIMVIAVIVVYTLL